AECADLGLGRAGNRGERNAFAAAPPRRRMVAGGKPDVAKLDVRNITLVTQLDRAAATAAFDFAALEPDIADVGHGFRADLQAGILRFDHAVTHPDILAAAVGQAGARSFDHDRIVAAGNIAVPDLDIATVVRIDAVAVRHIELVANLHPVNQH